MNLLCWFIHAKNLVVVVDTCFKRKLCHWFSIKSYGLKSNNQWQINNARFAYTELSKSMCTTYFTNFFTIYWGGKLWMIGGWKIYNSGGPYSHESLVMSKIVKYLVSLISINLIAKSYILWNMLCPYSGLYYWFQLCCYHNWSTVSCRWHWWKDNIDAA